MRLLWRELKQTPIQRILDKFKKRLGLEKRPQTRLYLKRT